MVLADLPTRPMYFNVFPVLAEAVRLVISSVFDDVAKISATPFH